MRFFLDENLSPAAADVLRVYFPAHAFTSAHDDPGMFRAEEDVLLMDLVATIGCDVFVTLDRRQMDDDDERTAVRTNGLHWVGIRQPGIGGVAGLTLTTAALSAGLVYGVTAIEESDQLLAIRINQLERRADQRIRVEPL